MELRLQLCLSVAVSCHTVLVSELLLFTTLPYMYSVSNLSEIFVFVSRWSCTYLCVRNTIFPRLCSAILVTDIHVFRSLHFRCCALHRYPLCWQPWFSTVLFCKPISYILVFTSTVFMRLFSATVISDVLVYVVPICSCVRKLLSDILVYTTLSEITLCLDLSSGVLFCRRCFRKSSSVVLCRYIFVLTARRSESVFCHHQPLISFCS